MHFISRNILAALFLAVCAPAMADLSPIADKELSDITGQAFFVNDQQAGTGISTGMSFFKTGLDVELELNTNIEKLQLGCGGINGPGCDIDIDQLSLSGPENCPGGRPNCSAVLTRPFIEFAIENPNSPTLREVVGVRFSAENAQGLMTAGDQQAGPGDPGDRSGINTLSGYLNIGSATGSAQTIARQMCYNTDQCTDGSIGLSTGGVGTAARMTGRIKANIGIGEPVGNFFSDTYRLNLTPAAATVVTNPTVVSGSRMTFVDLVGSATIGDIPFSGQMTANATLLGISLSLDKTVTGTIRGLTATVPIEQDLTFIHKIEVNNPFSLSMQKQDVLWPGAAAAAETGWWMAFEDQIDIGNISPEDPVPLTNDVLLQALTGSSGPPWPTDNSGSGQTCNTPSINCSLYRGLSSGGDTYGAVAYQLACLLCL